MSDEGPEGKVQSSTIPEGLETLTMTISRNSDPGVIFHEACHIAKQFLSAREKAAMKRAADKALVQGAKNIRAGKEPTANGGIDPRVYKGEEAEAQIYRAWQIDRNAQSAKLIGRILTRIKDLANRLLSLFRENKGNVFRKIGSGEVYNRGGNSSTGTEFSTKAKEWKRRLEQDMKNWSMVVDSYIQNKGNWYKQHVKKNDYYKVMQMPASLQLLGVHPGTVYTYAGFFQHALRYKQHPGMNEGILKEIPRAMTEPVMILKGIVKDNGQWEEKENSFSFILDLKTEHGATIFAPVELNYELRDSSTKKPITTSIMGKEYSHLDMLLSSYGKTVSDSDGSPRYDWLESAIEKGQVLYFDKSKSTALSNRIRTNLPNDSKVSSALTEDSIKHFNPKVKIKQDLDAFRNQNPTQYSLQELSDGQVFDTEQQNRDAKAISDSMEIGSDQSMTKFSIKQKLQPRIDALKERIAPKLETGDRVSIAESTVDKLALPKQFRDYHVLGMVQSVSRYKDALTQQYFRWADTAKRTQAKLQGKWTRSHNEILDLIQNDEDTKIYTAILLEEDARKKVFSDDALRKEFHASDNVIEAHKKVRELLSDVRSEVEKIYSEEHVAAKNFRDRDDAERWAKTPFFKDAEVQAVKKNNGWWWQVKYTTPRIVSGSEVVDRAHFLMMQSDQNVHILTSKENPDGTFTVSSVTKEKPLADVPGYIPHMFHDFLIVKELSNGGKVVAGSGTSVKERVGKALFPYETALYDIMRNNTDIT